MKQIKYESVFLKECGEVCFCGVLLATIQAQIFHWQTDSYAEHMALGDFYDGFPDKLDQLVEAYQGLFKQRIYVHIKDQKLLNRTSGQDVKNWAYSIRQSLESIGQSLPSQATEIINVLDELKAMTDQLCYRLSLS
jgi:hypothetical protein